VRFDTTERENDLVLAIVERSEKLDVLGPQPRARLNLVMDLTATHANGCPMDFNKLLTAPDFDFVHDITGIQRHIDRETGKLGNCFLPRFAKPEVANA
jgi:hypothetical protein